MPHSSIKMLLNRELGVYGMFLARGQQEVLLNKEVRVCACCHTHICMTLLPKAARYNVSTVWGRFWHGRLRCCS